MPQPFWVKHKPQESKIQNPKLLSARSSGKIQPNQVRDG